MGERKQYRPGKKRCVLLIYSPADDRWLPDHECWGDPDTCKFWRGFRQGKSIDLGVGYKPDELSAALDGDGPMPQPLHCSVTPIVVKEENYPNLRLMFVEARVDFKPVDKREYMGGEIAELLRNLISSEANDGGVGSLWKSRN